MANHLLRLLFIISLCSFRYPLSTTDWGKVESDCVTVTNNVKQASDSWQTAMNLFKAGSSFFGPIGSVVGLITTLNGLGEPAPEEAILEKLVQLQLVLMTEFKRLGENMQLGFDKIFYHIDKTDYRENVIDEIRSTWDKLLILTNHPNNSDAHKKFLVACEDYKPEEVLLKMYDRIAVEPSILTSLITASVYDWESYKDFSSSVVQQMMQLENLFVYCEMITNNFTNITQSSSTESFNARTPKIVAALEKAETRMKADYLPISAPAVIHDCIDRLGANDAGYACINNTLSTKHPWSKPFLLGYCAPFEALHCNRYPSCHYREDYKGKYYFVNEDGCNFEYFCLEEYGVPAWGCS